MHPPISKRLPRRLLVVQVPDRHARARDDELAALADAAPRAVRQADAERGARQEAPRGAGRADAHVELREREGRARLGHAVALPDLRVREYARDLVRELRRERRRARGEHLDRAQVVILHRWVL